MTSWIRRIRYLTTSTLVVALVAAAVVTETATGRLTAGWLRRVGFAPRDFWGLELGRIVASALVTHGPSVLLGALVMTALSVAWVERRAGPLVAMIVFWGSHLTTVTVMSLIVGPLHEAVRMRATETLWAMRDVGPSAGYFGSLGFALGSGRERISVLLSTLVLAWLVVSGIGLVGLGPDLPQALGADLAHLLAFPMGWGSGWLWRRRRPDPSSMPRSPLPSPG